MAILRLALVLLGQGYLEPTTLMCPKLLGGAGQQSPEGGRPGRNCSSSSLCHCPPREGGRHVVSLSHSPRASTFPDWLVAGSPSPGNRWAASELREMAAPRILPFHAASIYRGMKKGLPGQEGSPAHSRLYWSAEGQAVSGTGLSFPSLAGVEARRWVARKSLTWEEGCPDLASWILLFWV